MFLHVVKELVLQEMDILSSMVLNPRSAFPFPVVGQILAVVLNPHWFLNLKLVLKVETDLAEDEKC